MPKRNRGGRRSAPATPVTPTGSGSGNIFSYGAFSDDDASQLRDDVDDRYTPSVLDAIKQYISKAVNAQNFSMSQVFNNKLNNGLKLNANEKFMDRYLAKGMHDIGKDIILYRGAHEDFLQQALGVKNYSGMSEQQLKNQLVGMEYTTKSYTSASYDKSKNPFYTGANSGGREVEMVIKAPKTTKAVFGAKSQTEMILNKGTKYKVTDVKYTGRTATPRLSGTKPVLQVEVEVVG